MGIRKKKLACSIKRRKLRQRRNIMRATWVAKDSCPLTKWCEKNPASLGKMAAYGMRILEVSNSI